MGQSYPYQMFIKHMKGGDIKLLKITGPQSYTVAFALVD